MRSCVGDAPQKPNRPSPGAGSQKAGFRRPALPYSRARGGRDGIADSSSSERNDGGLVREEVEQMRSDLGDGWGCRRLQYIGAVG